MRGRTLGEDSEEARQVQTWDRVFLRDRTFQVGRWGSGGVELSKRLRLNWRALKWPWAYLLILFSSQYLTLSFLNLFLSELTS